MIVRTLAAHHFAIYQSTIAMVGIVAVVRILWSYSWQTCLCYGALTVGSYWLGQGGVALIQRRRASRSRSLD